MFPYRNTTSDSNIADFFRFSSDLVLSRFEHMSEMFFVFASGFRKDDDVVIVPMTVISIWIPSMIHCFPEKLRGIFLIKWIQIVFIGYERNDEPP